MTGGHIIYRVIEGAVKMKLLILVLFLSNILFAQHDVLEDYIKVGLNNNLALKQKEFSVQQSISALKEARGNFLPTININARYSRADGGRTIDFPVGDIVNPIHAGLNQLMNTPLYPTNVPNQEIYFLREKEHETKINVTQPVFDIKIYNNYSLHSNLKSAKEAEKNIYARELIKEIKTAYYNYLKTLEVVRIYEETEKLVNENLRVSKKLYDNDKVTADVVHRAQTELSKIEQEKTGAVRDKELAAAYFNFLLNRELDAEIIISRYTDIEEPNFTEQQGETLYDIAGNNREELTQLENYINARDKAENIAKAEFYPGLYFSFDYGYQGEEYKFTNEYDYWMASLVLKWNLFNGFKDGAKVEQSRWEKKKLEAQKNETIKQINLQLKRALKNLEVAEKSLITANHRLTAAEKSFEIVNKKYKNGLANQIEYLDAQTNLTQASINRVITKYDYQIILAELERVTAQNEIPRFDIKAKE